MFEITEHSIQISQLEHYDPTFIQKLIDHIEKNDIQEVDIGKLNQVDENEWKMILTALGKKTLTGLYLTEIPEKVLNFALNKLLSQRNLSSLNLDFSGLRSENDISLLGHILQWNPNISKIDLCPGSPFFDKISDSNKHAFLDIMFSYLKKSNELFSHKSFSFSIYVSDLSHYSIIIDKIEQMIDKRKDIKICVRCDNERISITMSYDLNKKLPVVSLNFNNRCIDLPHVERWLKKTNVKELHLSNCSFEGNIVETLGKNLENVAWLSLSGSKIKSDEVVELASCIKESNLQELNMSNCDLTNIEIVSDLASGENLESLYISGNPFYDTLESEGLTSKFWGILAKSRRLRYLDISNTGCPKEKLTSLIKENVVPLKIKCGTDKDLEEVDIKLPERDPGLNDFLDPPPPYKSHRPDYCIIF